MEMGGNFCQILELGGLLLRDGEYRAKFEFYTHGLPVTQLRWAVNGPPAPQVNLNFSSSAYSSNDAGG